MKKSPTASARATREFQKRNIDAGLCSICGRRELFSKWRCELHEAMASLRYHRKNVKRMEYRLEKAREMQSVLEDEVKALKARDE
jgi:hypothetical protein